MATIPLIALKRFAHHGRTITVGERFDASPIEAASYHYRKLAMFAQNDSYRVPPAVEPESLVDPTLDVSDEPPKRRYRRRDLLPESEE